MEQVIILVIPDWEDFGVAMVIMVSWVVLAVAEELIIQEQAVAVVIQEEVEVVGGLDHLIRMLRVVVAAPTMLVRIR